MGHSSLLINFPYLCVQTARLTPATGCVSTREKSMDSGRRLGLLQRVTFRCGSKSTSPTGTFFFLIFRFKLHILIKSSTNANFKGNKPPQLISFFSAHILVSSFFSLIFLISKKWRWAVLKLTVIPSVVQSPNAAVLFYSNSF